MVQCRYQRDDEQDRSSKEWQVDAPENLRAELRSGSENCANALRIARTVGATNQTGYFSPTGDTVARSILKNLKRSSLLLIGWLPDRDELRSKEPGGRPARTALRVSFVFLFFTGFYLGFELRLQASSF